MLMNTIEEYYINIDAILSYKRESWGSLESQLSPKIIEASIKTNTNLIIAEDYSNIDRNTTIQLYFMYTFGSFCPLKFIYF